jgi:hypothetical protein
LKPTTFL